jgi:hypothetical protein
MLPSICPRREESQKNEDEIKKEAGKGRKIKGS